MFLVFDTCISGMSFLQHLLCTNHVYIHLYVIPFYINSSLKKEEEARKKKKTNIGVTGAKPYQSYGMAQTQH